MDREPRAAPSALLSTLRALPADRRFTRNTAAILLVLFLVAAPFATRPVGPVWAFIPTYQSALILCDLMTVVLLFGQFRVSRAPALLALATGYLFSALIAGFHLLTYPGVFGAEGVLGGGPQTTAWIYNFWHAGFPLFVLAYAVLKGSVPQAMTSMSQLRLSWLGALVGAVALAAAAGCTLLATAGHASLPRIMQGHVYTGLMTAVVATDVAAAVVAGIALWRRRPHTVLDLWLMVVMLAWLLEVLLTAAFSAARFDLGFYAGRVFGLLAASFVLSMLLQENGALYARVVKARTEDRRKAREAQRMGRELAELNQRLRDTNDQLTQASRLKSEFLANMSHELRTPLNAIIGFSEMMKDGFTGELSPKQREYIGHVHTSGRHLLALINDILDLSKIEAGKAELMLDAVNLDALTASSLALFADRAQAARITLRREVQGHVGSVHADARRVRQIVDNLLSNAMKFTPVDGQVTLSAEVVDRARASTAKPGFREGVRSVLPDGDTQAFVEISVSDSGIGMRPEDTAKLFTAFTQIHNALSRTVEGTGLGLAMVRQLAELHGGAVAVTSEPGRGSCFTVWLPRDVDAASAAGGASPALTAQPVGRCALVIEDDEHAALIIREQLETEGFDVRRVRSGEEALALAVALVPDVITLDVVLPGMDGWEFLSRLKDVPAWADVPVVVVSVIAEEGRGISLGASLVLQKPVARERLLSGLARLGLAGQGDRPSTALVIDDDPQAIEILAAHLQQSGHLVLRALGGREGIDLAHRYRPDVIALDLEMPGISGFEVVEALKDDPATAHIPILIVTSRQLGDTDRVRLNGQIHDIVDKNDFGRGRFIGEVRRAVARAA